MSISTAQWIVYVGVALMCGLACHLLTKRSKTGFVVSFLLGLGGAVLAGYLASSAAQGPVGITINGSEVSLLWPLVGAIAGASMVAIFGGRRESSS